jgi:hypothetical protein
MNRQQYGNPVPFPASLEGWIVVEWVAAWDLDRGFDKLPAWNKANPIPIPKRRPSRVLYRLAAPISRALLVATEWSIFVASYSVRRAIGFAKRAAKAGAAKRRMNMQHG